MDGLFKKHAFGLLDIEKLTEKNRVVAHPDDYVKLAESGVVHILVKFGVEVVMSSLCEPGKLVATGELAVKLFKYDVPKPPGAE